MYSVSQCLKSGLIEGCIIADGGEPIRINDISPAGHEFLGNIRNDTVFKKTKETLNKTGIFTLKAMMQIATSVSAELIKSFIIQP